MTTTPLGSDLLGQPRDPADLLARADGQASPVGWFTPAALALAALTLGLALQVNFGQYHPSALARLALALVACIAAAVLPNFGGVKLAGWRPDQLVLAVGLTVQFALLWVNDPAATFKPNSPDDLAPFKAGIALSAALVGVGLSGTRVARAAVPLFLLTHLALGVWVLHSAPAPGIDVYTFQHDACNALLRGENPYAITFPDVYNGKLPVYAPGVSQNGRLMFGYPYPPLTLLLALPGHLFGDFRYAQLVALTLAGMLIAYARPNDGTSPGARAVAAAAMLLFTPRSFFILEAGWTEPFAILMLAAAVFCGCRRGVAWGVMCAISFGLLLACKQYLILALPLVPLLMSTPTLRAKWIKMTLLALLVAAVVTLPIALWDIKAFLHSAVTLQFHQPFRNDALSFLVPLANSRGVAPPMWLPFAAAVVAIALALWRCPRTPAGFATGFSLVFFTFFAFNKQAFCNYYALVLAALCCALAALPGCPLARPRRA